jgi:lipopolysaccharide export system protein LptA
MINTNFVMDADTLKYNTDTNISNILGPTHIVYQDETNIYSDKGWYNTASDKMMLLNRSKIIHKDGKTLIGDTVFYDKKTQYGESFINVILTDSIRKTTLMGDYIYYNEISENGLATDSALLVDWSTKDTLWVHADTLRTFKDSVFNVAKAYYDVRIFRNDVQGVCDSMVYLDRDSVMNMHGEPVLWAESNQLSGDFIQIFMNNDEVDHVHIQDNAMAVQKEDSLYFNQLSGKEIIAYLDSGELRKVDVNGNAETIYYPRDDADSTIIGINKTESSYVFMYIKNRKIDRMVMTTQTTGIIYPLDQLSGTDLFLKNYVWLEELRPKDNSDLMTHFEKKERVKIGTSSLMGAVNTSGSNSGSNTNNNNTNQGTNQNNQNATIGGPANSSVKSGLKKISR